ncbi:MAG: hypothetical protein ABSD31_20885 [Candidatus Binataceae bacterium]
MELGQYQLQIFVSLVVILGAAFVALICDFLKGNNEQLRELMIELMVRREEEQRRGQVMTAHSMQTPPESASSDQPLQQTGKKAFEARAEAARGERKRAIAPEALAAMERGAQLAAAPRAKAPAPAATVAVETKRAPAFKPVAVSSRPSIVVGKKDWGSLLARHSAKATPAAASTQTVPVTAASETVLDAVPAGFHEGYVLSQLVRSKRPVSGLVVSIGVNTTREGNGSAPDAVKELIQSLIGPADFASQSSPEEFLLICPSERGAAAQRRLSEIAEQLWNFQLRSMGDFSILFSWGGVEVQSESIDEAIASANERMKETRRGRKLLMMEPRDSQTPLRQAV